MEGENTLRRKVGEVSVLLSTFKGWLHVFSLGDKIGSYQPKADGHRKL